MCVITAVAEVKIITHVAMDASPYNEPMARITIIPVGKYEKHLVNIPQFSIFHDVIKEY